MKCLNCQSEHTAQNGYAWWCSGCGTLSRENGASHVPSVAQALRTLLDRGHKVPGGDHFRWMLGMSPMCCLCKKPMDGSEPLDRTGLAHQSCSGQELAEIDRAHLDAERVYEEQVAGRPHVPDPEAPF